MGREFEATAVLAAVAVLVCSFAVPAVATPDDDLDAGNDSATLTSAGNVTGVDDGTPVDVGGTAADDGGTTNDSDRALDATAETVAGAAETPVDADAQTNATDAAVETTETVDDVAEGTVDGVDETTGATARAVADAASNVTEGTADAVEEAATEVTGATNETTQSLARAVPETTDAGTADTLDTRHGRTAHVVARPAVDPNDAPPTARDDRYRAPAPNSDDREARSREARARGSAPSLTADGGPTRAPSPGADGGEDRLPRRPVAGVAVGAIVAGALARQGALAGGAGGGARAAGSLWRTALDRLFRVAALFRYSSRDGSDPLEHDARESVFEAVQTAPGTYLSKLAERTDVPLSTVRYHLRVLEREELVSGTKVRGKRRFYPAHVEQVELAAALSEPSTANILDALARLGVASVSDLAGELDRDPSTVSHHLQRLAEDDLVVRERDGRAIHNRLAPEVRTALEGDSGGGAGEASVSAD